MSNVRLPNHIKPERYELIIKPDLKDFVFEGEEKIELTIAKSTNEIVLHAKELEIKEVELKVESKKLKVKSIAYDPEAEIAKFSFNEKIPAGKGELSLKFTGILNDKMRGFYRSRYLHQGKEKHLATTQFEATDARRAFPCFDEPSQKAIFDVTLIIPKHLTAISNTIESAVSEHESGYKVVKFEPTPKMSTYLLAFIVGDFEYIEGRTATRKDAESNAEGRGKKTGQGTLVRVFVTPGKKHQAEFALKTAIRCMEFYEEYFGIPYPLPVLDLIAIPDFTSAAMENWGAVTYRESALLIDEQQSSLSSKQWVAIVIAHELSHQWFGDLVTMEWWTHLWLNEGFASYMEHLATAKLFPEWKIWQQFVSGRINQAMELDALNNTHPIEVEVRHPSEISEIFDSVSYAKGSAVIRMLAEYLGEKTFRDGLRHYLKKHSYRNTVTEDLWKAFEKISKKPVTNIMRTWTQKPGYPLIKVTQKPDGIKLEQSRFYSSFISQSKNKDKTVWQIPLTYSLGKEQSKNFLMDKKSVFIKLPKKTSFVKLNAGEKSLVRIDYPSQMLGDLGKLIKEKTLPVSDRLGVIRDAFSLSESGNLPTSQALELSKNFINEDNYNTWLIVASGLVNIDSLIYGQEYYEQYQKYCKSLFSPLAEKIGFKAKANDSGDETLLRSLALRQAGRFGDVKVIKQAKILFNSPGKIPADIKSLVYSLAAANGNANIHSRLIKMYIQSDMQEEKDRIARALCSFKQESLLKKTLNFSLSKNVRSQDCPFIVAMVLRNNAGTELGWQFIQSNWPIFLQRYGSGGLQMIARIISALDGFKSADKAKEIQHFFKVHKAPGAKRTIQQIVEKIYSSEAWLKRDSKHIQNWLKEESENK